MDIATIMKSETAENSELNWHCNTLSVLYLYAAHYTPPHPFVVMNAPIEEDRTAKWEMVCNELVQK